MSLSGFHDLQSDVDSLAQWISDHLKPKVDKADHPKALLFVQGLKWPGFLPQLLYHPQA